MNLRYLLPLISKNVSVWIQGRICANDLLRALHNNTNGSSTVTPATSSAFFSQKYKLEEIDLINRNAKLMVFYCRRKHFHHYTVCAVPTSGDRNRRNSADLDENGDLETLLLPVNDLLPSIDAFSRTEPWRPVERSKSSEELYNLIGDEVVSRDATSETRNQEFQSGSVRIVDNQLGRCAQPAITGLTVQTSSLPESYGMEFTMPLSGTVALSVEFPSTYPATVPVFTVTDHEPPLPNEVIQQLKEVSTPFLVLN